MDEEVLVGDRQVAHEEAGCQTGGILQRHWIDIVESQRLVIRDC